MDFYVCFYASVTSAPVPADLSLVKDCRLDLSLCTEYHKLRTSLEPAKDQQLSWSRVRTVTYCSQASQGLHRTKGCRQLSAQPQVPVLLKRGVVCLGHLLQAGVVFDRSAG